jgi:hypothetical protein
VQVYLRGLTVLLAGALSCHRASVIHSWLFIPNSDITLDIIFHVQIFLQQPGSFISLKGIFARDMDIPMFSNFSTIHVGC